MSVSREMTRRALLLVACAAFVPGAAEAARRRRMIWKPRKPPAPDPGTIEPKQKTVRTMLFDSNFAPHPTFEQRWVGEPWAGSP